MSRICMRWAGLGELYLYEMSGAGRAVGGTGRAVSVCDVRGWTSCICVRCAGLDELYLCEMGGLDELYLYEMGGEPYLRVER